MGLYRSCGVESPAGQVVEAEGDAGLRKHRANLSTTKTPPARPKAVQPTGGRQAPAQHGRWL